MREKEFAGAVAPPPLIYALALIAALLLQASFPLRFSRGSFLWAVALLFILASGVLASSAFRALRRAGTTTSPYSPTRALVVSGPYRFSRNPMYLSLTLLYSGIAILAKLAWALIMLPALLAVVHFGVVRREEKYLAQRFGAEYLQYRARVRRWI